MKHVVIYTDGACSGNPGPGGWGCVMIYGEYIKERSGFMPDTTNNRMELFAAIEALRSLKMPCQVDLFTDSAYLVNAIEKHWIDRWTVTGWKTADKKPVENQDLWKCLLMLMQHHEVTFHKVKGHADNRWNNRCDELATSEIKQHRGQMNGTLRIVSAGAREGEA